MGFIVVAPMHMVLALVLLASQCFQTEAARANKLKKTSGELFVLMKKDSSGKESVIDMSSAMSVPADVPAAGASFGIMMP